MTLVDMESDYDNFGIEFELPRACHSLDDDEQDSPLNHISHISFQLKERNIAPVSELRGRQNGYLSIFGFYIENVLCLEHILLDSFEQSFHGSQYYTHVFSVSLFLCNEVDIVGFGLVSPFCGFGDILSPFVEFSPYSLDNIVRVSLDSSLGFCNNFLGLRSHVPLYESNKIRDHGVTFPHDVKDDIGRHISVSILDLCKAFFVNPSSIFLQLKSFFVRRPFASFSGRFFVLKTFETVKYELRRLYSEILERVLG